MILQFKQLNLKINNFKNQKRNFILKRKTIPKPTTFKLKEEIKTKEEEQVDLTKLKKNSPLNLKKEALKMYEFCKLNNQDPITKLAIVRQMRNLDLPPHEEKWEKINIQNEIKLYNWINEAFGQILFFKKLWKPTKDWNSEDDKNENEHLIKNQNLIKFKIQNEILFPLIKQFGKNQIEFAISNLNKKNQNILIIPKIIWTREENNETCLEWMSEFTADVIWPGLISCKPEFDFTTSYWENEAKKFANLNGGIACKMNEQQQEEEGFDFNISDLSDDNQFINPSIDQNKLLAETLLIKQFLQDQIKN